MAQYQIYYQHGGHIGPYYSLHEAEENANRLLIGLPAATDKYVEIWIDEPLGRKKVKTIYRKLARYYPLPLHSEHTIHASPYSNYPDFINIFTSYTAYAGICITRIKHHDGTIESDEQFLKRASDIVEKLNK